MVYKALVSDFDGTMVGEDVVINNSIKEKITQVRDQGYIFSFATGRSFEDDSFKDICQDLGLTAPQIIHGGARIVEPITNKILWQQNIPDKDSKKLIKIFATLKLPFVVRKDKYLYTLDGKRDPSYDLTYHFKKLRKKDITQIPKIDVNPGTAKLSLQKVLSLEYLLEARFDNVLFTMVKNNDNYYGLDITSKKASKSTAFLKLCEILKLKPKAVIVIGDSYNDYCILQEAGFKIVMGNAPSELKKIADYITKAQEKNGFEHALDKFLLT